jgi:hypothetical protein
MKTVQLFPAFIYFLFLFKPVSAQIVEAIPETLRYQPFIWPSEVPENCPFEHSESFNAVKFLGLKSGYRYGDTWYPSWASNDTLYSPWTDGTTNEA